MRPLLPRIATRHDRSPRKSRRTLRLSARLAVLVAAGAMALAACSSAPDVVVTVTKSADGTQVTAPTLTGSSTADTTTAADSTAPTTTSSAATDAIRITATPAFGATDVAPDDPITLMAFHADLTSVTMSGDDGSTIKGEIGDDHKSWAATEKLKYGVKYTISGEATGADGAAKPFDGAITTIKPAKTMAAYIQIPDGQTVGIASPIVVTFAGSVTNRAAAEKQLHVTTTDANGNPTEVVGSWGWMQDEDIQGNGIKQSRVHFRPKEYWPAHTKVHVEADLYGVNYGSGWGRENVTRDFVIGPKLVVKTDIEKHRLYVVEDDKVVKNYPVSYGKESIPGRNTVSGIHIVQDKKPGAFKMCNLAYGYCNVTEYWGVRINNNGEFIHVNKETEAKGLLGKANVSHGCVNMSMADGKQFFDMMYYGVPVEVTGTGVQMSEKDYVWDWSKTWDQWKALSAL